MLEDTPAPRLHEIIDEQKQRLKDGLSQYSPSPYARSTPKIGRQLKRIIKEIDKLIDMIKKPKKPVKAVKKPIVKPLG